jgi:hypothetical protein
MVQRELVRLLRVAGVERRTNVKLGTVEQPGLEPGDVMIPGWGKEGGDLYIDLFVAAPWPATSPDFTCFAEERAVEAYAVVKEVKYAAVFALHSQHEFLPLGFDVFSGIMRSSLPFLHRLHRRLQGREAYSEALVEPTLFPRLSLSIACLVGHQLEARLPLGRLVDRRDSDFVPGSL